MRSEDGSIFDVAAARKRAEQLAALRDQRMLLAGVSDAVEGALRRLRLAPGGVNWCSVAQRRYSERRAELDAELAGVGRAVDDALAGVRAAIAVMTAAE